MSRLTDMARSVKADEDHIEDASQAYRLPIRVVEGLKILLEASQYAQETHADPWDFAVDMRDLRSVGLTVNECRWLSRMGLVEHANEVTCETDRRREFVPLCHLKFTRATCFVLTNAGVQCALGVSSRPSCDAAEPERYVPAGPEHGATDSLPTWNPKTHELLIGIFVVKQFKQHSPNQEAILTAFQEELWPRVIDDPIPPHPGQDPKQRLRDAIKNLNRNQKHRLLRFSGVGSGEAIRWDRTIRTQ